MAEEDDMEMMNTHIFIPQMLALGVIEIHVININLFKSCLHCLDEVLQCIWRSHQSTYTTNFGNSTKLWGEDVCLGPVPSALDKGASAKITYFHQKAHTWLFNSYLPH